MPEEKPTVIVYCSMCGKTIEKTGTADEDEKKVVLIPKVCEECDIY